MSDEPRGDRRAADPAEWSDADWGEWFATEVASTPEWRAHESYVRSLDHRFSPEDLDRARQAMAEAQSRGEADEVTERVAKLVLPDYDPSLWEWEHNARTGPYPVPAASKVEAFSRLSQDLKLDFYRSWQQITGRDAGTDESVVDELTPIVVDVPHSVGSDESAWSPAGGRPSRRTVMSVAGVVVGAAIAVPVALALGSGEEPAAPAVSSAGVTEEPTDQPVDETGEDGAGLVIDDPVGDWLDECARQDAVAGPPGADITSLLLHADGDEVVATITYNGDARSEDAGTNFGIVIRLTGPVYVDAFQREPGKWKVSDGTAEVTGTWLANDRLELRFRGFGLDQVERATANTLGSDGSDNYCDRLATSE